MALEVKATIPGLPEEAQRALRDVQQSVARECQRIEQAARRPRRRVTELVEEGSVLARPGEVVRVQPGDTDVTVVLPEPSAASDGEDIIVSFEGDGTAAGKVQVVPASGTCLAPGVQTLNAPGSYRFTSTGGGQTVKPRSSSVTADTSVAGGSGWAGPPPVTVDDLPPITPDELDLSVAGPGLTGGGGTPLTVGAGDGIDVGADSIAVDVTDIAGAGLETDGSNNLRIAASAAGAGLIGGGGSALAVGAGTGITVSADAVAVTIPLTDGDKGDITVASSGTSWTVDNDAITNAKLRNSGALSVIGRSANSSGDPADISATAGGSGVLRESGSTIGFGQIALAAFPSIADDTFLANISGASGVPSAVALTTLAGAGLTGGADAILNVGAGTGITVNANDVQLSTVAAETFFGNFTASSAAPSARAGTSVAGGGLTYTAGGTLAVGAGTGVTVNADDIAVTTPLTDGDKGDITVSSNGTVFTIDNDVVTDAKLRNSGALSVIGRSANSTGDPADISTTSSSAAVLRESGGVLGFGTVATAGIADAAVTLAKLESRAAGTVIGRQIDAGSGVPVALSGLEVGELLRMGTRQAVTLAATTNDQTLNDDTTVLRVTPSGSQTLTGMTGGTDGRLVWIENIAGSGNNLTLASLSASSLTANRFRTPNGVDLVLKFRESALARWDTNSNDWRIVATSRATAVADADYGDITVSSSATVWTIDNDVVTDAKLRNSGALSVIGRSANSTGDPADISASAASDAVLRESGSTIGWGTVATGGIANDAVTDAKLRNSGALSVIGRSANSTGDPADISAVAAGGGVLRESGSTIGFGTITLAAFPSIADDTFLANISGSSAQPTAVALSTLAGAGLTGGADAVLNVGAGTGITVNANDVAVTIPLTDGDKGDITVSSSGTVFTVDNDVVSDAKLRNSGALSVIGRSANSSGDPADISAVAAAGGVLRESGSTIGFGTITLAAFPSIADDTFLANIAGSSAQPTAVALSTLAGDGIQGGADAVLNIDVSDFAGTGLEDDGSENLRIAASAAGNGLTGGGGSALAVGAGTNVTVTADAVSVDDYPLSGLADQAADTVVANVTAGAAAPTAHSLSTLAGGGLTYAAGVMAVGAGTGITVNANDIAVTVPLSDGDKGDITVASSGTSWTIDNDVVSDAKLRNSAALSVIGRSANSSGDPADISGTASSDAVLRISGTTLGFGTVATAGIADAAVTLAKLESRAAGTVIGRQIDAGSGVPVALTGLEVGELLRMGTAQSVTLAAQVDNQTLNDDTTVLRLTPTGAQTITGMTGGVSGRLVSVENVAGSGNNLTVASLSASSLTANRFRTPNGVDLILRFRESALARWDSVNGDWRIIAIARATAISDADYGDITVTSSGTTWTIDNDVVSDAKLRNSGALSVIGRSANSTGDPADISASAASDAVLRESGSTIGWGTVATGGIANNAVTDAKLRQGGALSVIGRSANSTGNVADISTTADGDVLRRSGTTLGFGSIATAGITDAAVTLAKMANLAQSTIIGRAEGAGTGVPTALSATQVAAIIDQENITWTGTQTWNGGSVTANVTVGDVLLGADPGGVGLFSGQATANVTNGDMVLNSAGGIALNTNGTAVTSVTDGRIALTSTTLTSSTSGDTTIASTGTGATTVTGGSGGLILTSSSDIGLNSPTTISNAIGTGAAQSSSTSVINDLALTGVPVLRLSASNFLLQGIDASTAAGVGQLLIIANVHATDDGSIIMQHPDSAAANRFAGTGTSRAIRAGDAVLAWYDTTSSRWRLIGSQLSSAS